MKSLQIRMICWFLIIALLSIRFPFSAIADTTPADIYDTTSLIAALDSGADITLWQDLTIESDALSVCEDSTINLNGHKLIVAKGVIVHEQKTLITQNPNFSHSKLMIREHPA